MHLDYKDWDKSVTALEELTKRQPVDLEDAHEFGWDDSRDRAMRIAKRQGLLAFTVASKRPDTSLQEDGQFAQGYAKACDDIVEKLGGGVL